MSRFTLNSPWIRSIFPPSEMPREGPSILSDDVQLTADFFGGGYSFREPQAWFSEKTWTKAADRTFTLIDLMPVGQIVRIHRCGVRRQTVGVQAVAMTGGLFCCSPDGAIQIPVSSSNFATIVPLGANAGEIYVVNLIVPLLVPGGSSLYWFNYGGDNVDYTIGFLACAAPRGVAIIA